MTNGTHVPDTTRRVGLWSLAARAVNNWHDCRRRQQSLSKYRGNPSASTCPNELAWKSPMKGMLCNMICRNREEWWVVLVGHGLLVSPEAAQTCRQSDRWVPFGHPGLQISLPLWRPQLASAGIWRLRCQQQPFRRPSCYRAPPASQATPSLTTPRRPGTRSGRPGQPASAAGRNPARSWQTGRTARWTAP